MHDQLNGTNGAPRKVFSLAPPPLDERTLAILHVRKRVLEWPRRRKGSKGLIESEKAYFAWLLDRSLDPQDNERPGVVVISETVAARTFNVTKRTIWEWKWNLIDITGEVWTSKVFRPNMGPGDRYHITVLDPKKAEPQHARDGIYGGKKLRGEMNGSRGKWGEGARKAGQQSLPLPGSRSVNGYSQSASGLWVPDFSQVPETSAVSRSVVRLTAETGFGSQPKQIAADSRNGLRLTAEADCGSEPKQTAVVSRNVVPISAEADFVHNKRLEIEIEHSGSNKGSTPPPISPLEEWKNSLKGLYRSKLHVLRNDLTARLRAAQEEEAKAIWRERIAIVDAQLLGPIPQEKPKAPKPKTVPIIQRKASDDEILEGARYAISVGKRHLLTAEQMDALQKVGELQQPTERTHEYHK